MAIALTQALQRWGVMVLPVLQALGEGIEVSEVTPYAEYWCAWVWSLLETQMRF